MPFRVLSWDQFPFSPAKINIKSLITVMWTSPNFRVTWRDVFDHVTKLQSDFAIIMQDITLKVEWQDWSCHSLDQPLYAEFLATDFIICQKIKVSFSSNSYSHIKKWLFMENMSFPLNRGNTVYFIPFDLKIS